MPQRNLLGTGALSPQREAHYRKLGAVHVEIVPPLTPSDRPGGRAGHRPTYLVCLRPRADVTRALYDAPAPSLAVVRDGHVRSSTQPTGPVPV